MRVAIVVQRYGREVIGGAESHARIIAERLTADCAWQVEVFTTTAQDYETWASVYPEGSSELSGVTVHRFAVRHRRYKRLFKAFNRLVAPCLSKLAPSARGEGTWWAKALRSLEHLWFVLQGPYCPTLLASLQAQEARFHKVFFFTYLYYPTAYGLPALAAKAVLIPTAHDEPPLYFPRCRQLFAIAPVQLLNSPAEQQLITRLLPPSAQPVILQAGLGVAEPDAEPKAKPEPADQAAIPEGPYLLYLGRLSKGKGVTELFADFLAYCAHAEADPRLSLVVAGALEAGVKLPSSPRIHYAGVVSNAQKQSLLQGATGVVNPSPRESLSLLVLEALQARVPVLVNGQCSVLATYAAQTTTVFSYRQRPEFIAGVQKLLGCKAKLPAWDHELTRSQEWVQREYSWEKVLAAYQLASQT